MRNVVLLQPSVGDMDLFRDRPTPPVALLAAAADVARDHDVRLVDQRLDADWRSRVAESIDGSTVAVGVTALTGGMIGNGLEMARAVRSVKDVPIVWGGVHASLMPAQTAAHDLVDFVVEGEGERTFAELVRRLSTGRSPSGIPGIWRREGGRAVGVPRGNLEDIDTLPPVPWHLVDMERYIGLYRDKRQFFYQSSRGCPFRCAYCYNTAYNHRRWRAMAPDRVLAEIEALRRRYEFQSVYFLDDDFFVDAARAMTILKGLQATGLTAVLQGVDVHAVSRLTDDDLSLLEALGVERISIGVESGTDRIRVGMLHKWGSIDVIRDQLQRLRDRRFLVLCTFIIGFPGETADEMRRTVDLAMWTLSQGTNFRVPQLYNFTPYPGTELFRTLADEGFSFPQTLDGWSRYEWDHNQVHGADPSTKDFLERLVFLSKFLDRKEDDYGFGGPLLRSGYRLYRPLARLRVRTGWVSPLPERSAYRWLKRRGSPASSAGR